MLIYSRYTDAIAGLHEKGYRNDFVLFGDGLLWVQEKIFLRSDEFCILECHEIEHPADEKTDLIIFGILDINRQIKGILMHHYSFTSRVPSVIVKKLNEMTIFSD